MSCSFCGHDVEPGTGTLFVKRDGSVFTFCSSKCKNNQLGLKRINRYVRWTKAHEKGA